MPLKTLLIDDDPEIGKALVAANSGRVLGVIDRAYSAEVALGWLAETAYGVVLIDLFLAKDDPTGLDLISRVRALCPGAIAIMLTSHRDQATAVLARSFGATDYIIKRPGRIQDVLANIEALVAAKGHREDLSLEARAIAKKMGYSFASPAMEHVLGAALTAHNAPKVDVLIRGETGVGKETIAEIVSRKHAGHPFVVLNCANLSSGIVDSELFGHQKGAFTGSVASRMGQLHLANGGDIFLDEVDSLPLETQAKLLRALENREITKLGANEVIKLNIRVIAATNADLNALVAQGRMRADFLARLRGFEITVPPLRARPEDIGPIVQKVLEDNHPSFSIDALCLEALATYSWPENVRELKKRILAMAASAAADGSQLIGFSHFPLDMIAALVSSAKGKPSTAMVAERTPAAAVVLPGPSPSEFITVSVPRRCNLAEAKAHFEREFIKAQIIPGVRSQRDLGKILNVSRSALSRLLADLRITVNGES